MLSRPTKTASDPLGQGGLPEEDILLQCNAERAKGFVNERKFRHEVG